MYTGNQPIASVNYVFTSQCPHMHIDEGNLSNNMQIQQSLTSLVLHADSRSHSLRSRIHASLAEFFSALFTG